MITDATERRLDETILAIVRTTPDVFDGCRLPNGALIAAPSHLPVYPIDAPARFVCHPGRDIPLAIAAMRLLGREVAPQIAPWVFDRALNAGFLVHAYAPNGFPSSQGPDRDGARLIASAIGHVAHPNRVLLAEGVATQPAATIDELVDRITDVTPPASLPGDATPLWADLLRIVRLCRASDRDAARARVRDLASLADDRAHLPEWEPRAGSPNPPRPSLPAHCAFVIAAAAAGYLDPA